MKVSIGQQMIDIVEPQFEVEVLIGTGGDELWVNVDGLCRLRVGRFSPSLLNFVDLRVKAWYQQ